jgi:hypothetical protein
MKIVDFLADRIDALDGVQSALTETFGSVKALDFFSAAKKLAEMLVENANDGADVGRLAHGIDCLREVMESACAAEDIGRAKRRRIQKQKDAPESN